MKVLITNRLPKKIEEKFLESFDCDYNDSLDYLSREELLEKSKDAEVIVCPLSEKIDEEIIENAKNLKLIANFGAGFDNIDLEAASEREIVVTNTPSTGSTTSTSELTMGLMIDLMRMITYYIPDAYDGTFEGWKPNYGLGTTLKDKTLGVIGFGKIGSDVARKAQAFDMDILYWNRTRLSEEEEKDLNISYKEVEDLLKESDVVTLHTAYHPDLHHFISDKEFDLMKETAFLVNASRGPIVSEKALMKALHEGKIQGAALDVFEFEPEISEELKDTPNLLMAPHLGNATIEARNEMGEYLYKNVLAISKGEKAPNQVNEF